MWLLAATIGLCTGITGLAAQPLPLLLGAGLIGAGLGFSVIENTVLRRYVAPDVLGRVYAVNVAVSYAPGPFGYLLAGADGSVIGVGPILMLGGAATLAMILTVSRWATDVPAARPSGQSEQPKLARCSRRAREGRLTREACPADVWVPKTLSQRFG